MNDKPIISQEILDGISMVRETGVTNMFDTRTVAHILKVMGLNEVADWVLSNKEDYAKGILYGFETPS